MRTVDWSREDPDAVSTATVQEQVARLKFVSQLLEFRGKTVLDIGCGDGLDCWYAHVRLGARRVLGVDVDPDVVARARRTCPAAEFVVADACDSRLALGHWDVVLCTEVFEHVSTPRRLLETIARHLAPGGTAFLSTPNRPVFSLDYEPSPLNQDHVKEYDQGEFRAYLEAVFPRVELWSQQFKSQARLLQRHAMIRRSISDFKLLRSLYWRRPLRVLWKTIRLEPLLRWFARIEAYDHTSFDFVPQISDETLWLCALARCNRD